MRNVDHERRVAAGDVVELHRLHPAHYDARAHDAGARIAAHARTRARPAPRCPTARDRRAGPRRSSRDRRGRARVLRARVAPASASSGVRRNSVQAMFSISTSDVQPATCPGCSRSRRPSARRCARSAAIGGSCVSRRAWNAPGSSTATVPPRAMRRHAGLARVFEMIGRQRAEVRRERSAAGVRELVGVQLDAAGRAPGRGEHASRLLRRERDGLAERVDRVGEAARARPRESSRGRRGRRSRRAPARELRRHRMRSQAASCARRHRLPRQRARAASSMPPLGRGVETIARLDLDRSHAFRRERREARAALRDQRVGRSRRASPGPSKRCRRPRGRSPRSSRLRGGARTRPRGCPHRRDACGSRRAQA